MSLWVVVGGQYGSEGKGKVSAFITKQENIDICIRCGGPNSGHSFVDESGKTIVLRQLPTGFVNPRTRLLIPAGALIDPLILKQEIESLGLSPERVGIDHKCFAVEEHDRQKEQALGLRERLSSTLCGVGAAQSRRVLRAEDARLARDISREYPWMSEYLTDTSDEVNAALDRDKKVLIEGTQGFGLSLYHSDYYPKTTSRDTIAAGFLSEVGVSPRLVTEIVVVFRTFPIRVAGPQAGPLKEEISWEQLQKESRYPHLIEERTSVTHKVRRVARFDWELARRALTLNQPTRLAINGIDLFDYSNQGVRDLPSLSSEALSFIGRLCTLARCGTAYIGTGPRLVDLFREEMCSMENLGQYFASPKVSR
ncbi:MAG TPA: adenylosuccinate synthetase [Candidatus Acidoferrum sp.]|jgi:adenylosuccinate synthase|nr:adenylosuccinate synthetase [Candidatus Acidoferrum sp.]